MKLLRILLIGVGLIALALIVGAVFTPLPGEVLTPAGFKRNSAHYVAAEDGVRIAIDVWLPAELDADDTVPALIEGSRYWRATRVTALGRLLNFLGQEAPGAGPDGFAAYFSSRGYAYVTVDVRGTGASFGVHDAEYSRQEMADYASVINWIIAQPWSNGRAGAVGVSYSGTTAELMTTTGHPALRAVAPLYADFDAQFHLVRPGGAYQPAFVEAWNNLVSAMDRNDICGVMAFGGPPTEGVECLVGRALVGGVKPVDADERLTLLSQAVAEHNSPDVVAMVQRLEHRDSAWGNVDYKASDAFPYGRKAEIEASGVPMYVVTGWFDAATTDGALARFASFSNPQTVTIGPFSHGGQFDTDPYQPPGGELAMSRADQLADVEGFFAAHLKDHGPPPATGLRYFVQGAGTFRSADVWPPARVSEQTLYLAAEKQLTPTAPASGGGVDEYRVDYTAGTGGATRWLTQLGGADVHYTDREAATTGLLRFETRPFEVDTELTGTVVVNLWLSANRADGAVHAYLDDVGPDGTVRYLSEGVLRLIHRATSADPAPYPTFGVNRSFLESDAQPMPNEEPQLVAVPLFATSALIRAGHRLRLSIGGADATSFARYPAEGTAPKWEVHRSSARASSVTLPLAPWSPAD